MGPLGFGTEFWRPMHEHPNFKALVALSQQLGGDEKTALYYATSGLIREVLHAAGAIEYAVGRIELLISEAQRESDDMLAELGGLGPKPEFGRYVGSSQLPQIAWEWGNLLAWTRGLEDRIRRDDRDGDLGLLPSMNPDHPATAKVRDLWRSFKSTNVLEDVRNQAALNLHAASIFHVGQPADLEDDGRVLVKVPDPVLRRVGTREELTFKQGRDILVTSKAILDAVERFVDDLLDIFERWQLNRWTPPRPTDHSSAAVSASSE
jgi:hypothetical protein